MNSQVKTAQMSINSEQVNIKKMGYIHTMEYYSATKRNEVPSATWMSLDNLMLRVKKPDTKGQIVCDFIYVKCPGKANPQRQEVGQWLLRGRGWNEE